MTDNMKNEANIYDIDGNIVRKAGDNTPLSIDEAQKRIDDYNHKIDQIQQKEEKTEDDLKKLAAYTTYIRNLYNYVSVEMMKLKPEELKKLLSSIATETTSEDAVKEALEDVKQAVTQEDLLVERDTEAPVMDEYVDFVEENEDNKE